MKSTRPIDYETKEEYVEVLESATPAKYTAKIIMVRHNGETALKKFFKEETKKLEEERIVFGVKL